MPEIQKNPLGSNPTPAVLQDNLRELFELAHGHVVKSSLPLSRDGVAQDIAIVDTGSAVYLCVKTKRGWFRTDALTAL